MIRAATEKLLNELALLLGEKVELEFGHPIDPDLAKLRRRKADDERVRAARHIVDKLVAQNDPELADEIERKLADGQFQQHVRPVVQLLERIGGPASESALRRCLELSDPEGVAHAIHALRPNLSGRDVPTLQALLHSGDSAVRVAAIVAAGQLGEPALADAVARCLKSTSADERMQAAITLGVLRATRYAGLLVDRLELESDRCFEACVAALEMMGDREVIPRLVELLSKAPETKRWNLSHALWVISGIDPIVEEAEGSRGSAAKLRAAWLQAATTGKLAFPPSPAIDQVREEPASIATFDLSFGRGALRIDYDPPPPGATWPRWSRSLFVNGQRVYGVGSTCSTCELLLRHAAWPKEEVSRLARELESAGSDAGLSAWIALWAPLIQQLRSGRYLVGQLEFPVERIDRENVASSWFNRRRLVRVPSDPDDLEDGDSEPTHDWPGTVHYQGPQVGAVPTYPMILPMHDPATLDGNRIAEYQEAIAKGVRPPVVALAWLDARRVRGQWHERVLSLFVLNGHHRLEAYVRSHVAPPIVAVARVADSWGPPDARDRGLREALGQLVRR